MSSPDDVIEDYLRNKLTPSEMKEFESSLVTNAALQKETKLQSSIIESIKSARARELKSNLANIKIESVPFISNRVKVAVSAAVIGIISLYYFYPTDTSERITPPVNIETAPIAPKEEAKNNTKEEFTSTKPKELAVTEATKKLANPLPKEKEAIGRSPIAVVDPSADFESTNSTDASTVSPSRNVVSLSNILVENDESDKRYTFHYKFHKGKLILYGSFDSSLYEIIEINGEKRSIFLYYKEHYYLLDENQNKIKMLQPIQDATLVGKLTEYRLSKK
jgi:hypothetical protein